MARSLKELPDPSVRLDLNNPEFQRTLFALPKQLIPDAISTFRKLSAMTWSQVYRDHGLHWERIESIRPPEGVDSLYSLRITQSARALAYRDQAFMRFLLISADHDATYGKK